MYGQKSVLHEKDGARAASSATNWFGRIFLSIGEVLQGVPNKPWLIPTVAEGVLDVQD
jgi:hypothetical protein